RSPVAGQEEDGRHQRRRQQVPEGDGHGQTSRRAPREVQRAVEAEGGGQQQRGPGREHVIHAAVLAANGLPRDAGGANGGGAHGLRAVREGGHHVRGFAREAAHGAGGG